MYNIQTIFISIKINNAMNSNSGWFMEEKILGNNKSHLPLVAMTSNFLSNK